VIEAVGTTAVCNSPSGERPVILLVSVQDAPPNNEAIKRALGDRVSVPGAEVYRGDHLRLS
jgi:hypothetical protein